MSNWWGNDAAVAAWNGPIQRLGVPVLPYLIAVDNSTQMHMVYDNSTAVVADAVAIAKHYGFSGWFIDYEYVQFSVLSVVLRRAGVPSLQNSCNVDGLPNCIRWAPRIRRLRRLPKLPRALKRRRFWICYFPANRLFVPGDVCPPTMTVTVLWLCLTITVP